MEDFKDCELALRLYSVAFDVYLTAPKALFFRHAASPLPLLLFVGMSVPHSVTGTIQAPRPYLTIHLRPSAQR